MKRAAFARQPARCVWAIEILEDRQLLSATATATPSFVVSNSASATATPNATTGVSPINPTQMRAAYGVNLISFNGTPGTGAGQTIAIVDAYNNPNIISDAVTFNSQFGLSQFNVNGGPTLRVLNQSGQTSLPANASAGNWDLEESLDVEWAHAIAPGANIILFEANSSSYVDLLTAVNTAADYPGVSAVSMSWGGGEFSTETWYDSSFITPSGHPGVTFVASTGDSGAPAGFPAFSSNVLAVGGTSLNIDSGGNYIAESAWSSGGGGISKYESQPSYQAGKVNGTSSNFRTAPDVSMDSDPASGVLVLDSFDGGWLRVGGTSLAAPMWGGLIAIADQGRALAGQSSLDGSTQTLPMLYGLPGSDFHDITTGSNGTYAATAGYDLATGRGTPIANLLVPALAGYGTSQPQPPGISAPSARSLSQNASLTFSATNGNAITAADPNAGGNADSLTISAAHGTLTLASTTGLTFAAGANGSASMTVTGTLANLNNAINGLIYRPNSGYVGSDSLNVSITDPGDGQSASAVVALTVNATVSAPTITAPSNAAMGQNGSIVFSTSTGNAIAVADSNAHTNSDSLALSVAHGTLRFASTTGLKFSGAPNGSAKFTVTGTLANINAALNGLTYQANAGYAGSDGLTLTLKNSVDGLSTSASVALTSSAASAPSLTAPASGSLPVNGSLVFSTTQGDAITVTDANAGNSAVRLTLTATHGTLTLSTKSGLIFSGAPNGSASFTVTGHLANINAALNGLIFNPTSRYSGAASISLAYTDVSSGQTASATIAITVGTTGSIFRSETSPRRTIPVNSPTDPPAVTAAGSVVAAAVANAMNRTEDSAPIDERTQWAGMAAALALLNP